MYVKYQLNRDSRFCQNREFEINPPVSYIVQPNTEVISASDKQTDGTTDGRTPTTTIGSFFEKEKNTKNRPF